MFPKIKNFNSYFLFVSYAVVFCGFLSLAVAGGISLISSFIFLSIFFGAWFIEDSKWQVSEKIGTASIFLVIPVFYLDWKYKIFSIENSGTEVAATLARMILILAAVKLLQKKSERDWIFLYLMSFFEVLLAAGMSISPLYLASLVLYLLFTICAIIIFEIKKTANTIEDSRATNEIKSSPPKLKFKIPFSRFPAMSIILLLIIIALAMPLFFAFPRVSGAGQGNTSGSLTNLTGFSDSVSLGSIGRLKQNNEIVMRARLEGNSGENASPLKWRGVALDNFDNKRWSKSRGDSKLPFVKGERDFFLIDYPSRTGNITIQTVYLEPIDTPVLFSLQRPIAVQGNINILEKDAENSLSFQRDGSERVSYKVHSDRTIPDVNSLKSDNKSYPPKFANYLQLPRKFDPRIAELAKKVSAKVNNRYDKAKQIESFLQNDFGYSLEMKAGGEQPLADFLFNIREGHCEYFATAMAIMLRTQGIATRVVNGFQQGEYNETADVYIIRQSDAHSWVEVYFPEENAWIPFDPTPFAGQSNGTVATGIVGKFNQYLEALETFWIQYFVSYDNQEQRSLVRSLKSGFSEYQIKASIWLTEMQYRLSDWWAEVRGDRGLQMSAFAVAYAFGYLIAGILGIFILIWLYRRLKKLNIWQKIFDWFKIKNQQTIIEFYERMQKVLEKNGYIRQSHQTPLEFAFALDMPEAIKITEKYNRVRFGEKELSKGEATEIENWLNRLENRKKIS